MQAQAHEHARALEELRRGQKQTHWIWFVLPQLKGLGTSAMAQRYGLTGLDEARAYHAHPLLGRRLLECVAAISAHAPRSAASILGSLDARKYQSCLTLFEQAAPAEPAFADALRLHFAGERDRRTLELLGRAR